MIAVIPVEGPVSTYNLAYSSTVQGAVKVNLSREGVHMGTVTFGINATPTNPRATEATYLLTGAYIRIQGEAMFDVPDETLLTEVLEAL